MVINRNSFRKQLSQPSGTVIMLLYVLQYVMDDILTWNHRKIKSHVDWLLSWHPLSEGKKQERDKAISMVHGVIDETYSCGFVTGATMGYMCSILTIIGTFMGYSFSTIQLFYILPLLLSLYITLFVFSEKRILSRRDEVKEQVERMGTKCLWTCTLLYVIGAIPIYLLSLHIMCVFGNPAG